MNIFAKRLMDIFLTGFGLVILSPILLVISILIQIKMGKPVLFAQTRPGFKGKPFKIFKFRTMIEAVDKDGNQLPDSERMTKIGNLLRRTSLDELPELLNVLKGDMALVGPRPLLMEYLDRYSPEQARRMDVKPGVTGWAQINGRNAISWEEKFDLDLWYVDNWNFVLDLKIIWLTFIKVIKREGISAAGEATMPVFMGSESGESDNN